jgi:probable F420-dependent oxidoreductase
MKIGLQFPSSTVGRDPFAIRDFAQAAEGLDYSHLIFNEHIVEATPTGVPNHDAEHHEMMVLLSYIAGVTSTIGLLTAVLILPQRQTVVVAKQAAELDLVSGGRLRLGVGVGNRAEEYQATGADYHTRGKRMEEQVKLLRELWTNDWVDFIGDFHETGNISLTIPPVQRPIPVWMGGSSNPVLERVGRMADGWLTTSGTKNIAEQASVIKAAAKSTGRNPDDVGIEGRFEIAGLTPDEWRAGVEEWASLGATHLNVRGAGGPASQIELARQFKEEVGV